MKFYFSFLFFVSSENYAPFFMLNKSFLRALTKLCWSIKSRNSWWEATFAFSMYFLVYKSGCLGPSRTPELCRACRALEYTRSVVFYSRSAEFAAQKRFLFILCCVFWGKGIQNFNFFFLILPLDVFLSESSIRLWTITK